MTVAGGASVIEQQRIDPGDVVSMAAGQAEPLEPTELVDDGVDLGGAPAARFADCLGVAAGLAAQAFFLAPPAARCALIAVLSIISMLAAWRPASASKMPCQMPCLYQ